MRCHRFCRHALAWLLICAILFVFAPTVAGASTEKNRFNVAIILDASGSILSTDPDGYRYQAVEQFAFYLAEQGNTLGGVVFNSGVLGEQEITAIRSQAEKNAIMDKLISIPASSGWTNIGAALDRAVTMLEENGDPALASVILLFSDGNTAMGSEKETRASLDLKEEALQTARERNIAIYSVCLNADHTADVSEMEQISRGTGGVFREVSSAEDLKEVFRTFYGLIYGTQPDPFPPRPIPDSGYLETIIEVPGIGVEEVNINIYGNTSDIQLLRPDGSESAPSRRDTDAGTMLKATDLVPGIWTLVTYGVPGTSIEVDLVYNTDLGILVSTQPAGRQATAGEQVTICAQLTGSRGAADSDQQYTGYSAELQLMNGYRNFLEGVPMEVRDGRFQAACSFDEGTYFYKVVVTGNNINKESEAVGPLTVKAAPPQGQPAAPEEPENMPPVPVEEVVEATVNIWPFKGGSYTLDLNSLAIDAEDDALRYRIASTSFLEGTDYTLDDDGVLYMDHFSLSKGAFTIEAIDSGGLSCEIEVIVRSVNIGLLTLIGLGVLALLGLIIFAVLLRVALSRPFRGTITAHSYCNGVLRGMKRDPRRGRCKLAAFGMDNVGLNYQKSYFQATGKNYIELCTDKPVFYNGQETTKVRITSGAEVTVGVGRTDPRQLYIRFDSRMTGRGRSNAPRRPAPPRGGGPMPRR